MDMSKTITIGAAGEFPEITAKRASSAGSSSRASTQGGSLSIAQIHGSLLAFATVTIFAGIIGIRSGHRTSFAMHWILQSIASAAVVVGCYIGIHMAKGPVTFSFWGLHKTIGGLILLCAPVQLFMGHKHHINYLKFNVRTKVSHWHMWTGRAMFLGLNINIAM